MRLFLNPIALQEITPTFHGRERVYMSDKILVFSCWPGMKRYGKDINNFTNFCENSEILDVVDGNVMKCDLPEKFPFEIFGSFGATGGLVDQRIPVVCGGIIRIPDIRKQDTRIIPDIRKNESLVPVIRKYGTRISDIRKQDVRIPDIRNSTTVDQCYIYAGRRYQALTSMKVPRTYASGMVLNGGPLWVTGGRVIGGPIWASTELIYADGIVRPGKKLPSERYGHCMVQFHDGTILLLGGK